VSHTLFLSIWWWWIIYLENFKGERKCPIYHGKIDKHRNIFWFDLYKILFDIYEPFEIVDLKVKSDSHHHSRSWLFRCAIYLIEIFWNENRKWNNCSNVYFHRTERVGMKTVFYVRPEPCLHENQNESHLFHHCCIECCWLISRKI
jgi:hypothetical protein